MMMMMVVRRKRITTLAYIRTRAHFCVDAYCCCCYCCCYYYCCCYCCYKINSCYGRDCYYIGSYCVVACCDDGCVGACCCCFSYVNALVNTCCIVVYFDDIYYYVACYCYVSYCFFDAIANANASYLYSTTTKSVVLELKFDCT